MDKLLKAILKGILMGLEIQDDELDLSVFQRSEVTSDYHADRAERIKFIKENFVDLGLPSGILWCKWNLGATNGDTQESWYGDYYAWGETKPKVQYTCDTCKYYDSANDSFTKYNKEDGLKTLDHEDDVVSVTLGSGFKMPSNEDFEELCSLPCKAVENYNGIIGLNGRIFFGNNGNELFIPAAGYRFRYKTLYIGTDCSMWSSLLYVTSGSCAYCMHFDMDYKFPLLNGFRYYGRTVRAIIKPN